MALYKDCENCGKEFSYNKSRRPNARFCSRSCLSKVTKKEQDAKRELGWYLDTNEQVLEALKSKYEKFVIKNDECWD